MNMKNIRSKKALKFLGLLISAMLIATVSAVTYRYLYIDGSIWVGGQYLSWVLGSDAPSGASVSGTTAIMDFSVEEGTPLNFTEALFLKNNNDTGFFTYNITVTTNVQPTNFQRAQMHIYENYTVSTWTYLNTIDLTNATDFYSDDLGGLDYLRMTFEFNATTVGGPYGFAIQVEYWA